MNCIWQNRLELAKNVTQRLSEANAALLPTFSVLADEWQETEHYKSLAYGTQACYNAAVNRAKDFFGADRVTEITPNQCQALIKLAESQKLSKRTVTVLRITIKLIFDYGIICGYIANNPVTSVKVSRNLPKSKRQIPSGLDLLKVATYVDAPFGLIAALLLYTGCRRGEALALRWHDIDFENRIIHIHDNVVYKNNTPHLHDYTKTEAGQRDVILLDTLANILVPFCERSKRKDALVFGDENGEPLTNMAFRRKWEKYCATVKIDITPHQLRHAYATILVDADIPYKDAQHLMGHSSIKVTMDIYADIRESRAKTTGEKLNAFAMGGIVTAY